MYRPVHTNNDNYKYNFILHIKYLILPYKNVYYHIKYWSQIIGHFLKNKSNAQRIH